MNFDFRRASDAERTENPQQNKLFIIYVKETHSSIQLNKTPSCGEFSELSNRRLKTGRGGGVCRSSRLRKKNHNP